MQIVEVADFWPEVRDDLTLVIWSHATNSKELLEEAIEGDTMMIEADISIGEGGVPIMAHPPQTTSNLTLAEFLDLVVQANNLGTKKGIKLDFKFIEIVAPSLDILKELESQLTFPLWLNADILQGPGGNPHPVDADLFLDLCFQQFPSATLSIGYTTASEGSYTESQFLSMFNLIKEKGITSPVTLPLRASLAAESISEVLYFLRLADEQGSFPATITIWSGQADQVDFSNLEQLIERVGRDRTYMDVPWETGSNPKAASSSASPLKSGVLSYIL